MSKLLPLVLVVLILAVFCASLVSALDKPIVVKSTSMGVDVYCYTSEYGMEKQADLPCCTGSLPLDPDSRHTALLPVWVLQDWRQPRWRRQL